MKCWEFKKCGREEGGAKAEELGMCQAYPDHGNHCARVTGTLCGGEVQGSFAVKLSNCMKCGFYKSEHYDKTYTGSKLNALGNMKLKERQEVEETLSKGPERLT